MIRLVVCDWNRTLCDDPFEVTFFTGLIKTVALKFPNVLNLPRLARTVRLGHTCRGWYRASTASEDPSQREALLRTIIDALNAQVINGTPVSLVERYLNDYAQRVQRRLDLRLMRPLRALHERQGASLVVLSSGCAPAIERALQVAGFPCDVVVANEFERQGSKVKKFAFHIYGNKTDLLKRLLAERQVTPEETAFIGDDWEDRDCFALVGLPIVSFLASEPTRARLRQACGARTPTNEAELMDLFDGKNRSLFDATSCSTSQVGGAR